MSKEKVLKNNWKILKFSECIEQLNTGLNPRNHFSLGKGNIKYITAKNLTKLGTIDFSKCDFIDEKAKFIINRRSDIKIGDILFSSRAPIGHCHLIKAEPNYFDIGESIFSIRVNKEIVLPEYLCLYLSSDYFIKLASKNTTGSIIQEIRISDLMNTDIIIPPKDTQKCIAESILNVDKKIELNNKINAELEAMAKTIYDYWFLQFEFPNEDGKPYKSSGGKMVWNEELKREIPEGWEIKSIFDELSVKYGFPFATDKFTDVKTDIPVVRIRDILTNTISTYSNENVDEKYRLNEQDLLIGMDGNFHMNYWIDNTSYLNQRSVRLRTKDTSNVSIIQVKYNIAPYIKAKEERAGGSTVGHLSDKDLKELKILVPKTKKLREILDNTLMKIVKNRKENQELTSLRDFLLPLLMNGQVGFKEE